MKILNTIKNYGLFAIIIKFLKKSTYRVFAFFDRLDAKLTKKRERKNRKAHAEKYKQLANLFENPKYKYIFVFYPYTEWALPIFQRPQQVALAMTTKRDDVLYFYCTANYVYDKVDIFEQINDNLYLCTDYDFLTSIKTDKRIIHLYSTDTVSKLSVVKEALARKDKVLYEYIDEIHEDITQSIPDYFFEKHNYILAN